MKTKFTFLSFKDFDLTDIIGPKATIDMFADKVILYDDENLYDYTKLKNETSNKKEQSKPNCSDCSSLVPEVGLEPT